MAGIALQLTTAPTRALPRVRGPVAAAERSPAPAPQPPAAPVEMRPIHAAHGSGRTSRARAGALAVTAAVHLLAAGLFLLSKNPMPIHVALPGKPIFVRLISSPQPKPVEIEQPTPQQQLPRPVQAPSVQPVIQTRAPAVTAPQPIVVAPAPPPVATLTTAPPAPASVAAAPAKAAATSSFHDLILARLQSQRRYPPSARARRQEGVVQLRFTMNRRGQVLDQSVAGTSGVAALDREAMDTLRRAQPLPSIPADLSDPLELTVAIDFSLSR